MLSPADAELVRRLKLFRGVEPRLLSDALKDAVAIRGERGERLRLPGNGTRVWIVSSGMLQVDTLWGGGKAMAVDVICAGDLLGAAAETARGGQVVPFCAASLCGLTRGSRDALLSGSASFAANLAGQLERQLDNAQAYLALFALPAKRRLAHILLRLGERTGGKLPMTRRTLAELAGVRQETAIRLLSPWEKARAIKTADGHVLVLKPERLKAIAQAL